MAALNSARIVSHQRNTVFDIESTTWQLQPFLDDLTPALNRSTTETDRDARMNIMLDILGSLIIQLITWLRRHTNPNDYIQVSMHSRTLNREVMATLMTVEQFDNGSSFFEQILNVLNSNEQFQFDESVHFTIEVIPFTGGGTFKNVADKVRKKMYTNLKDFALKNKACWSTPDNLLPGYCGPVSLILGARLAEDIDIPTTNQLKRGLRQRKCLEREARELMINAGLAGFSQWPDDKRLSIEDMKDIITNNDNLFGNYAITIIDIDNGNNVLFTYNEEQEKQINMGLVLQHFVLIKSMPGFFNVLNHNFWCPVCKRMISGKMKHACRRAMCSQCKCIGDCVKQVPQQCRDCKRVFLNETCYFNHLVESRSPAYKNVCKQVRACSFCNTDLKCTKEGVFVQDKEGYFKDAYKLGTAARHICFARKCFICGEKYDRLVGEHKCYVKPMTETQVKQLAEDRQTIRNYYFDLETRVDTDEDGMDVFVVNAAVIKKYEEDLIDPLQLALGTERITHVFKGENCMQELADFLFFSPNSLLQRKIHANIWSHNGGRFNIHFILERLVQKSSLTVKPKLIASGKTIKMFSFGTLKFLDSKMFLPMALAQFSKTFNIPLKKGWFPHDFNRKENESYEGEVPDVSYFDKKGRDTKEFKKWHARLRREGYVWNFWKEIIDYCDDDVNLLMFGMEKFSTLVYDLTGVFPGGNNCSLASMANQAWRKKFIPKIPELKIGVVPELGYPNENQSAKALQWLHYMNAIFYAFELQFVGNGVCGTEKKVHITLEQKLPYQAGKGNFHTILSEQAKGWIAREANRLMEKHNISLAVAKPQAVMRYHTLLEMRDNGPDFCSYGHRIKTYKLDGYHEQTRTALEFYGCLFHGCLKCYEKDSVSPLGNETMQELNQKTMQKESDLRNQGLEVRSIWECEWDRLVRGVEWNSEEERNEIEEIQSSIDELGLFKTEFERTPMKPRESMRGGRMNNRKLLHICTEEGEEICYNDVTSLYPTVMSKCFYPVGHPKIITACFDYSLNAYFGVAKAIVVPPSHLWHPVLPAGIKDEKGTEKLMFPLCRTCACEHNFELNSCNHSEEEKSLNGCWTTPELYLAVEMGYKIEKFIEVWHYTQKTDRYFKEYIQTFFKLKAQAKGYPDWADTVLKKAQYLLKFEQDNGIELDPEEMQNDKAMYGVAKLFLNTLWGYFSKYPLKGKQTNFITQPGALRKWLNDPSFIKKNFCLLDENVLITQHKVLRELQTTDVKGSMVHASFTTAHARCHLYRNAIQPLGDRVLYFDTDSVIYIKKKGQQGLPLGEGLGDMTDEIEPVVIDGEKRELYCAGFVSGGPKNYAMMLCVHNRDGSIPPYHQREVHHYKTVIRGFSLSKEAQKVLNFEQMCQIVFRSSQWFNGDDSVREELVNEHLWFRNWVKEGGEVELSGLINHDPPVVNHTTFELGDRQPIRGINLKRKRP